MFMITQVSSLFLSFTFVHYGLVILDTIEFLKKLKSAFKFIVVNN